MLHLNELTVSVGSKSILKKINFTFEKNKVYVVMGPNGSGKSTLAYSVMGHPSYVVGKQSRLFFKGKDITNMPVHERAASGIFLSFQTPLSLQGVTVFQLLRVALNGKKDPLSLKQEIMKQSKLLKIQEDVVERPLNEGASGGERKKMELLQAAILKPELAIFDEIDTGVDIDALKILFKYINTFKKDRTIIFITHNSRVLKYIHPDKVLILKNGTIVKTGGKKLLDEVEKKGFENL